MVAESFDQNRKVVSKSGVPYVISSQTDISGFKRNTNLTNFIINTYFNKSFGSYTDFTGEWNHHIVNTLDIRQLPTPLTIILHLC